MEMRTIGQSQRPATEGTLDRHSPPGAGRNDSQWPRSAQAQLALVLVRNWVLEAIRTKDTATIVEIFNRIDGKVQDRIALGGDDGEPIRIQPLDVHQFTDEELRSYEALIRKGTTPRSDD